MVEEIDPRARGTPRRAGPDGGQRRVPLRPVGAERDPSLHVPHRPRPRGLGRGGRDRVRLVTRVAVGDHVVLTWMPPCRQCFWCLAGQPMLCNTGMAESLGGPYASVDGTKLIRGLGTATFAQETLVPERQVVAVDRAAPLELAALVGCALSTGIGAVWHTAGVEPGSTVAVIGCGGVGLSVIQGARLAGASTIVAVDRMAAKLPAAKAMGATARRRLVERGRRGRRPGADRWAGRGLRLRGGGPGPHHPPGLRGGPTRRDGRAGGGRVALRAGHLLRLRALRGGQDAGRLRLRLDRPRPRLPRPGGPGDPGDDRRREHGQPPDRARRHQRRLPGHGGGRGRPQRHRLRRRRGR